MFRKKTARVLLAEGHSDDLLRWAAVLEKDAQLCLVAAVSTGAAAIAMMVQSAPDVLVLDLQLPDMPTTEVVRHAAAQLPQADIVVLTQFGNDAQVLACIAAGATGYVFKSAAAQGLGVHIQSGLAGCADISPGMARRVLGRLRLSAEPHARVQHEATGPLSGHEVGILRWVARGMTLEQIGALTCCTPDAVLVHVKTVYRKLAAHTRAEGATTDARPYRPVGWGASGWRM